MNSVAFHSALRVLAGFLVIAGVGLEYAKANGAALGLSAAQIGFLGLLSVMIVAGVALLPRVQGDGYNNVRAARDRTAAHQETIGRG